ncbi:MAG: hypothetical protein H6834_10055 [Planctomycetes bacterium]|nr:hypothetical protein [Planctomycetota bacterium]
MPNKTLHWMLVILALGLGAILLPGILETPPEDVEREHLHHTKHTQPRESFEASSITRESGERPPDPAPEPALTRRTLITLDAVTERPVPAVAVFAIVDPVAARTEVVWRGRTGEEGRVALPDDITTTELYAVHESFLVTHMPAAALVPSLSTRILLEPRPRVFTVLERVSLESLLVHTFHVSLAGPDGALFTSIDPRNSFGLLPSASWNGLSPLELIAPTKAPSTLTVTAALRADPAVRQSTNVSLDGVHDGLVVPVAFTPPLVERTIGVTFDVEVHFPEDRELSVFVSGPCVQPGAPRLRALTRNREIETRTNVRSQHRFEDVIPGAYEWSTLVRGIGTFPMGSFTIERDDTCVRLHPTDQTFVPVDVEVVLDESGPIVDLRIQCGERSVAGAVHRTAETGQAHFLHRFLVPRHLDLHAIAKLHATLVVSLPVAIPSGEETPRVVLNDWVTEHPIAFECIGHVHPCPVTWLTIHDERSGLVRRTRAEATTRFENAWLPEGSYTVRACWDGGTSLPVAFTVPDLSDVVRVPM